MKAYLITTGSIFGLMAVVHVWRAIEEWPNASVTPAFLLGMTALIVLPGLLAWWAWCVLRKLQGGQTKHGNQ
ncbi:MAG: hypothetical protein JWR69_3622 [Pedosphaera sp.]|nr:hypothetical protein [Pedosphaera sp.]